MVFYTILELLLGKNDYTTIGLKGLKLLYCIVLFYIVLNLMLNGA